MLCGSLPGNCADACSAQLTAPQRACVVASTSCAAADACGMGGGAGGGGGSAGGGAGGGGGSGGGSGGGGGSTKPANLTISGSFAGKIGGPTFVLSQDQKILYVNLTAEAKQVKFSPTVSDNVDLTKAATLDITKPLLGTCSNRPKISNGTGNVIISFTAGDTLPSTACKQWAEAVKQGGLTADFTNVPYLNGGKAMTLKLDLGP